MAKEGTKQERGEAAPETTDKDKNFKGAAVEGQKGITGHDFLGKTPGGEVARTKEGGITCHHLLGKR